MRSGGQARYTDGKAPDRERAEAFSRLLRAAAIRRSAKPGAYALGKGASWPELPDAEDYAFCYVLDGAAGLDVAGGACALRKGTMLLLRPGDKPRLSLPEGELSVICVPWRTDGDSAVFDLSGLPRSTPSDNPVLFKPHMHFLLSSGGRDEPFAAEEFELVVKQLLIRIYRLHDPSQSSAPLAWHLSLMVREAIDQIREDAGATIDLRDLAKAFNISQQYFSRLFKQFTGESLKSYVVSTKLERALDMLADTQASISDISEALGYSEIYNFSKMFKQRYGVSPSYYRKSLTRELSRVRYVGGSGRE